MTSTKLSPARRLGSIALGSLLGLALASGCSSDGKLAEDVGAARIALTNVPMDVGCVSMSAVGARSMERRFPVVPGQSSIFTMSGLPTGDVVFHGAAYDGPCHTSGPGTSPSWVGDPVPAKILAGQVTEVKLPLRPNGRGTIAVDFLMDPTTGAPCVGNEPGCLSPDDASGSPSEPLPDGARIVSAAEGGQLLMAGATLNSARIQQAAADNQAKQQEMNRQVLSKLLANDPVLLERAFRPVTEDQDTVRQGDGTIEITLAADAAGKAQKVMTYDESFRHSEIADSLLNFPTHENQLGIYNIYYAELPDEYKRMRQLPDPKQLINAPTDAILELNRSLAADIAVISGLIISLDLPPLGYPASCSAEEGTPSPAGDQTGGSCTPANLFAKHKFPLKWNATCVKNQGNRGTCVSFGITGALEAAISRRHNRWVNLSEERLYYWAKVPTAFGDGLGTGGTIGNMDATAFTYPWELQWDYNPSSSRLKVPAMSPTHYTNSCVGYTGEHCSDTSHQGDLVCFDILFWRFCVWNGAAPASSGFRLFSTAKNFFDWGDPAAIGLAQLALALKVPLVMALDVTPSFDGASGNGIATYSGPGETSRGGHAVAVMGYITNANLPVGTPAGAGGGYFLVKNSWGKCWKDGGYVYLPFDWVAAYAYGIWSVGSN